MTSTAISKFTQYQYRREVAIFVICLCCFYAGMIVAMPKNVRNSRRSLIDNNVYVLSNKSLVFKPHSEDLNLDFKVSLQSGSGYMQKFHKGSTLASLTRWNKEFNYRTAKSHIEVRDEIVRLYSSYADRNGIILDSGAHLGDTTLPVFEKLRYEYTRYDLHLVLLEPAYSKCLWMWHYVNYLSEKHNDKKILKHIHIIQSGIWSHKTNAKLITEGHPGAWYVQSDNYRLRDMMKNKKNKIENFVAGDIPLDSIDNILHPKAIFSLWHLDAERSELRALTGLFRTMHRPMIIMEIMKKDNPDFMFNSDILRLNFGYKLVKRLRPNSDRVFLPPHVYSSKLESELPYYV